MTKREKIIVASLITFMLSGNVYFWYKISNILHEIENHKTRSETVRY